MGVTKTPSTLDGGQTPICNSCGIMLCWDIEDKEYEEEKEFWDSWICRDCNGGEPYTKKTFHSKGA